VNLQLDVSVKEYRCHDEGVTKTWWLTSRRKYCWHIEEY